MIEDNEVLMENMSWPEIEEAQKRGATTVLVPIASIEQHGPHLPVSTDTLIGCAIARKTAEKLGNALVAPPIRPGFSLCHMDFPGTVTLRPETLMQTIVDYCRSLAEGGFKNIVLIAAHGGNIPVINMIAPVLAREIKSSRVIFVGDPYTPAEEEIGEIMGGKEGNHANKAETSIMLAEHPELVDMTKAVRELPPLPKDHLSYLAVRGVRALSRSGVIGNGSVASREYGLRLLRVCSDKLAQRIGKAISEL